MEHPTINTQRSLRLNRRRQKLEQLTYRRLTGHRIEVGSPRTAFPRLRPVPQPVNFEPVKDDHRLTARHKFPHRVGESDFTGAVAGPVPYVFVGAELVVEILVAFLDDTRVDRRHPPGPVGEFDHALVSDDELDFLLERNQIGVAEGSVRLEPELSAAHQSPEQRRDRRVL